MNQIKEIFRTEFSKISDKFQIIEENVNVLPYSEKEFISMPGVYVFFNKNRIIKVGRHLKNSRKRAYEHITSNTKNDQVEMKNLGSEEEAKVILFNVKNPKDFHWVAAVEIFLELQLQPIIKSQRL